MANFKDIIEEGFLQYAGAVIQSRALVDVRDCLKPSARQIFYAMYTDKFIASKPYKKTLKAIGSAMRFFIHGDSSAEGAIMRAGQPFALRYPLIEVEGSYGNQMESANWAAPRYTSARLSKISSNLFSEIEKDTIDDWRDNYDDTEQYPAVLPSKGFYNLVNGTFGIGVGLASSVPQFNLTELNAALIKLLRNPNITFDEIYCEPDFATGGIIINGEAIKESLKKGNGKACIIRAKFEYNKKKNALTVVEMPYNVYTNTVCQQLEKIVNSEENPGISRINDLTGKAPKLVIYLEKGADPNRIENYLYANTHLQSSFGINMTMLDMGRTPKVFTWQEALQAYLDHEVLVYTRGYKYDLKKIEYRILIVEAIIKAIAAIEEVISTIKSSSSTKDANEKLQKLLNINEEQAKAILDIKLARLAKLEIEKFEKELVELKKEKTRIEKILSSEELLKDEIVKDLEAVAKKYGDSRRTIITNIELPKNKKEKEIAEIVPEDIVVVATSNSIKRVPIASFRPQRRGGKGVKNEGEIIISSFKSNTQDKVQIFTSSGRMYGSLVNNLVSSTVAGKGMNYLDLIKIESNEKVIAVSSLHRTSVPKYAIFFTSKGYIKKSLLSEYTSPRTSGITAIKLEEDDSLVNIIFMDEEPVLLITKDGMSIKFDTKNISAIGRNTRGVKAIKLGEGDRVVAAMAVHKETDDVAIFAANGLGKKVSLKDFPSQARGGKGTIVYKGESLVGAAMVDDEDNILLSGNSSIVISAKDIPLLGKVALGNILTKNKIQKITKI